MKAVRHCQYGPPEVLKGKLTPFVEKTYPMSETPNAMCYFEEGHARGKIVITVD